MFTHEGNEPGCSSEPCINLYACRQEHYVCLLQESLEFFQFVSQPRRRLSPLALLSTDSGVPSFGSL